MPEGRGGKKRIKYNVRKVKRKPAKWPEVPLLLSRLSNLAKRTRGPWERVSTGPALRARTASVGPTFEVTEEKPTREYTLDQGQIQTKTKKKITRRGPD